jgi:hypothetical protein
MKFLIVISLMVSSIMCAVDWKPGDWAFACDFRGGDLANAQIRGEDCGGKCAATSGCTHFTWTNWNGGTCWMKSGSVSKSEAFSTGDMSMVCGIVSSGSSGNLFILFS